PALVTRLVDGRAHRGGTARRASARLGLGPDTLERSIRAGGADADSFFVAPRLALLTAAVVALAGAGAAAGKIGSGAASVSSYPPAHTSPARGALPVGGGRSLTLNEPVGGDDSGLVVVSGAARVSVSLDAGRLAPLRAQLRFWHFVDVGSSQVPDALLPWDGSERATEQPDQP